MLSNDFILYDRIDKIRSIINQYGADNFYISFSGGKDSTVLSHLIDQALPDNNIPRVYINTGIDLNMISDYVLELSKVDERIQIVQPSQNIKDMLNTYGYPFKSKKHSKCVSIFQKYGETQTVNVYLGTTSTRYKTEPEPVSFQCPAKLRYHFTNENEIKISDKCCYYLKEKPLQDWSKTHNKKYAIIGVRRSEGGRRMKSVCLAFRNKKLFAFQPLVPVSDDWLKWYIEKYNIYLCDLYYPPYNFTRTGCKGCPFAVNLQKELDTLEKFFPAERKQCEYIWKPVYDEYRRINYRLKGGVDNVYRQREH